MMAGAQPRWIEELLSGELEPKLSLAQTPCDWVSVYQESDDFPSLSLMANYYAGKVYLVPSELKQTPTLSYKICLLS